MFFLGWETNFGELSALYLNLILRVSIQITEVGYQSIGQHGKSISLERHG